MSYRKKHINIVLLILWTIFILYLTSFIAFNFTFRDDEGYTFALIHHSFLRIMQLDSYDVHPPFYYIVLKMFLLLTTFWTKSIFIKIVFARAFSLITFVISLIFLLKILSVIKIYVNITFEIFFVSMAPSVLLFSTEIRMYSLGLMFIVILIYNSLLFFKYHKNIELIYIFIWIIMASYTHYFAALLSGLILITLFILCIRKSLVNAIKIMLVGIGLVISYLPWIWYTLSHLETAHHSPGKIMPQIYKCIVSFGGIFNSSLNTFSIPVKLILLLFIYIPFGYCIIWSFKNIHNKEFNGLLILNIILFVIVLIIGSLSDIILGYEFSIRFLYPSFFINIFILGAILLKIFSFNKHKFFILLLPLLLVTSLNVLNAIKCNIHNINYSFNVSNEYSSWTHSKSKSIFIISKGHNMPNMLNEQYLLSHKGFSNTDKATLLLYDNKDVISNRKITFPISNGNKFGKEVWNNIK